ncbi:MAG: hypothetical protein JNG90_15790, partial [Planctomycetaceae bacterium]|nr:hypothetical protein [Planctomycetaceae bacterium]
MAHPTDIRLQEISSRTVEIAYRTPMKFGGRVVTSATLLDVDLVVETRDGRRGQGHGSMPLGNVWAWQNREISTADTLAAMQNLGLRLVELARGYRGTGHPLEITQELAHDHAAAARAACQETGIAAEMPRLAQLVAASPLEAAIHDAYGKALGASSYDLLGPDYVNRDLGEMLAPEFAGQYLDRYTLRQIKPRMPLYHLVGALDPLTPADVAEPLNDGLPETLGDWIRADSLTHLKIKLNGDDLEWDVGRVVAIERAAAEAQQARGCQAWNYSLDFNERCANVQYVLDYLARVGERSPPALARVQYIEQPTHRDLRANPENRM